MQNRVCQMADWEEKLDLGYSWWLCTAHAAPVPFRMQDGSTRDTRSNAESVYQWAKSLGKPSFHSTKNTDIVELWTLVHPPLKLCIQNDLKILSHALNNTLKTLSAIQIKCTHLFDRRRMLPVHCNGEPSVQTIEFDAIRWSTRWSQSSRQIKIVILFTRGQLWWQPAVKYTSLQASRNASYQLKFFFFSPLLD